MKFIKQLIAILALLCATQVFAQTEGDKGYTLLSPPQPTHSGNKIEVLEFFFYGCSHCFKLHPYMSAWEKKIPKDVELTFVPAIFNSGWESMARTFYALEAMGQRKQLHDALFNAWNNGLELADEASVTDFVSKHGVDAKKFHDIYNSFAVQSQVMRAKQMAQIYGIRGTPTLVVDGKYFISGIGPEEIMKVLDKVLDKARKERAAGKH
ncbi:MAG: thiol:disulfide interchange protein DsbA/DsbL [Gallionellaceae bacterium]